MTDAHSAPLGAVRLADVLRATDIDPDCTAILAIGGRLGVSFAVSRWERAWFPVEADA